MKVYLTGGTGFIGSYVAHELAGAGHEVVVLAKNPAKVPALAAVTGIRVVRAPMEDLAALRASLIAPDALVHVALCWGDTGPEMIQNETLASVRLIELGIERGAKKILYTSSTAASGYASQRIDEEQRLQPADFYGATKGAVELFLSAYAKLHPKVAFNVIRPGYTFGNPVVPGGSTENDRRFWTICELAKTGADIELTRYDGTQFIWAGDLAKLFRSLLESDLESEIFYGLGNRFVSWETIAGWAVAKARSSSRIKLVDRGYSSDPVLFSLDKMRQHFGLSFDAESRIQEHLDYLLSKR